MSRLRVPLTFLLAALILAPAVAQDRPAIKPDVLDKIKTAMPEKAPARPKQARKLLVFSKTNGFRHGSIPIGAATITLMGEKTGAWTVTHTEDDSYFEPEKLKEFDAVLMLNTTGDVFLPRQMPKDDAEVEKVKAREARLKQSLVDFVQGGKGLAGFHSATDTYHRWGEYNRMMGGVFASHPWHQQVPVKNLAKGHPLNKMFKDDGFSVNDEIYMFTDNSASPTDRRWLLSLDTGKMDAKDVAKGKRKDGQYPISWVSKYGKGRSFYCSLGHRDEIYWNPAVLEHYLAGSQHVLGDLEADATPTEGRAQPKAADVALTPDQAGPDFLIQGEYVGGVGEKGRLGAEVIARGSGNFLVNFLPGGLRGEGGDYSKRVEGTARTADDKTTVSTKDGKWTATIGGGKLSGKTSEGESFTLERIVRKSKTLGEKPPQGAIVLYAGPDDTAKWNNARLVEEHLVGNETTSKQSFKSHKVHLEFRLSYMPTRTGQARSNSGVYIQRKWEVQVLDSFGLKGANNECGGIYSQTAPLVNMCYPPLQWQTYDIEFRGARFDADGKKSGEATLTVWHNGVLVHDKVPIKDAGKDASGPLHLQSHGGQVQYRNIWVTELDR